MNEYISNTFNLNNKIAAVIGGGGHICSELSVSLAKSGCYVYILDIRKENLTKLKKLMTKKF